jgi:hypothetical protein
MIRCGWMSFAKRERLARMLLDHGGSQASSLLTDNSSFCLFLEADTSVGCIMLQCKRSNGLEDENVRTHG